MSSDAEATDLVYVGRRRDAQAPAGKVLLDDRQVLPVRFAPLLDRATTLTVLDPMSFPFDALRDGDRAIPTAVSLPGGWDAAQLELLFGELLLSELTPFDAIALGDQTAWPALRRRHSLPETIRRSEAEVAAFELPDASARERKGVYRLLAQAIRRQLAGSWAVVPVGEHPSAALLADEANLWAALFGLEESELLGVDPDAEHVHDCRAGFPEWRFAAWPDGLDGEEETAHAAVCVLALGDHDADERRRRLEALLRTLRVGGRLIVVERFLDGRRAEASGGPSPMQLRSEINGAAARHLTLEHVESLRLAGDLLTSVGLFAFTKLGAPQRK